MATRDRENNESLSSCILTRKEQAQINIRRTVGSAMETNFHREGETFMSRIPSGKLVWRLSRYTRDKNLWDHVCEQCKQSTPVFEYEHRNEGEGLLFGYLCEACAQKKLASWLQLAQSSNHAYPGSQADFDTATIFYEQKNDGETLVLTRWSPEQRRRRLQGSEE